MTNIYIYIQLIYSFSVLFPRYSKKLVSHTSLGQ